MDNEKKNYYDVLEIPTNASHSQVEEAYTRAKNSYSGDSVALYSLLSHDECAQILSSIEEAYSVLGFPEKRREYDRVRGFNQAGLAGYDRHYERPAPAKEKEEDQHQYESFGSNLNESRVSKIMAQKKFGLEYNQNDSMEKKINDAVEFSGNFLKEIREYKNVTIERMADMTRVSKTNLMAVENEDLTKLPADVYVRGYVYQMAKVLKLNPDVVATSFMLYLKKLKAAKK